MYLTANSAEPTDMDLHCLQRQGIYGFSWSRVNTIIVGVHLRILLRQVNGNILTVLRIQYNIKLSKRLLKYFQLYIFCLSKNFLLTAVTKVNIGLINQCQRLSLETKNTLRIRKWKSRFIETLHKQ